MQVYGFGYTPSSDVFTTSDSTHGTLITDNGLVITGNVNTSTTEQHQLSDNREFRQRTMMRLLTDVDRQCEDVARANSIDSLSSVAAVLPVDDNTDPADVLRVFLQQLDAGERLIYCDARTFMESLELERPNADGEGTLFDGDDTASEFDDGDDWGDLDSPQAPQDDYQPRVIGDFRDIDVLRRARRRHKAVLLVGEPGTGKTRLSDAAHDNPITINCHDGMTMADVVGQWMPVPGSPGDFRWQEGPLLEAMQAGTPIVFDDFSWASNTVQAALLPVLDHRRSITVVDRPESSTIVAADGFCVVLTANPDVGVGITAPILDRIDLTIQVPTDLITAARLGVHPSLLSVAYQLEDDRNARRAQGGQGWVPSIRSLLSATDTAEMLNIASAASLLLAECPIRDPEYRSYVRGLMNEELGTPVTDGLVSEAPGGRR